MTLRHAALPIGAVLLLGVAIYLFYEVRSQPAIAQVEAPPRPPRPAPEESAPPPSTPPPPHVPVKPPPQVVLPTAPAQLKDEPPPAQETHEVRFTPNPPPEGPNPKLDAVMDEANKAYDHGDFDEAKVIAQKVLAKNPTNVRMLRIMVSSSCIDGDTGMAQANFPKLPAADQEQMRIRCARYGVTFEGGTGK